MDAQETEGQSKTKDDKSLEKITESKDEKLSGSHKSRSKSSNSNKSKAIAKPKKKKEKYVVENKKWYEVDYNQDIKELDYLNSMLHKRLDGTDRLLKLVEDTLKEHAAMGDPLTLDPTSAGYEQIMELYLKIIRAQKDLTDQFRKLKITNMEFTEKQSKIELRRQFFEMIRGKSLEEIRELALCGKFEPTNMIAANMLSEGAISDSSMGSKAMSSLSGWSMDVEKENNIQPSLTINLTQPKPDDKVKENKTIEMENEEGEIIDIEVETEV